MGATLQLRLTWGETIGIAMSTIEFVLKEERSSSQELVTEKTFAGIDQGISGAIAFLTDGGHLYVYDMPTITVSSGRKSKTTGKMGKKRILDFARIKALFVEHSPVYTVAEQIPISLGREGATSLATLHKNGGIILGLLFGLGIPTEETLPSSWQKLFFKSKGQDTKQLAYDTACKLFPTVCDFFSGPKGGIKDGRSDAALLATLARRKYYGNKT